jgi:Pyruvate/2-oxoacid:ferredoxin oxidoreductase delta subunit
VTRDKGENICVTLYDSAGEARGERAGFADLVGALLDGGLRVTVASSRAQESTPPDHGQLRAEWAAGQTLRRVAIGGEDAKDGSVEMSVQEFLSEAWRRRDEQRGSPAHWPAWFPVLDRDRCTDCRQCLNFCLFDVFAVDDAGHVQVKNPANCKNECPACARVCPEAAIIFPKYPDAPINGEEVDEASLQRESMTADLPTLLQGNVADALRRRSDSTKRRFSRERDKERALKERCDCLVQLQTSLGVPPQVIESISLDELRDKAADKLARKPRGEGD